MTPNTFSSIGGVLTNPYVWGPQDLNRDRVLHRGQMQNNKLVALVGAAAVVIGVFSPLISIPFFGAISYASQKQGEGFVMIGGAVAAALLCYLLNLFWPAVVTGTLVLVDVLLTLINLHNISGAMGDSSNPIIKAFANTVSPSWGFALLLIGGILLIVSACLKKEEPARLIGDKNGIYYKDVKEEAPQNKTDRLFSWFAGPQPIDNKKIVARDVKQEKLHESGERFDFVTQTWQPASTKKSKDP
jgi:hypothetical protein